MLEKTPFDRRQALIVGGTTLGGIACGKVLNGILTSNEASNANSTPSKIDVTESVRVSRQGYLMSLCAAAGLALGGMYVGMKKQTTAGKEE